MARRKMEAREMRAIRKRIQEAKTTMLWLDSLAAGSCWRKLRLVNKERMRNSINYGANTIYSVEGTYGTEYVDKVPITAAIHRCNRSGFKGYILVTWSCEMGIIEIA